MVLVMPSTEIAQWYSILIQKIIGQGESPWKYVTLNENFFYSFDTKDKIMNETKTTFVECQTLKKQS